MLIIIDYLAFWGGVWGGDKCGKVVGVNEWVGVISVGGCNKCG